MKPASIRWGFCAVLLVAAPLGQGCSQNTGPASPPGTGGSGGVLPGSGGSAGSGGSTGSGGTPATGGTTSTGGSRATGGTTAAGGTTESGGSRATGGTGGSSSLATGGVTSNGGASGKGGTTGPSGGGGTAAGGAGATGAGGTAPASGGTAGTDAGAGGDGAVSSTGGRGSGGAGGGGSGTGGQRADGSPDGAGGGTGYNPCKASPCKILPLGDSITHGVSSSDDAGYRSQLFKLAVAANQNVTFTGSLSNGPSQVSSKTFPKNHEGHDGFTVESGYSTYGTAGISSLIPKPAFDTIPDIVLLHIGTNDLTSTSAKSTTSDRLDTELGRIATAAPDALVVVAKLVPLGYSSSDWDNYNSKIPTVVAAHVAKGQHMVVVDMSKLPSSQLNGVHPNDQGYGYMANAWYEAIKAYLPN